jgi:hypothetical protein
VTNLENIRMPKSRSAVIDSFKTALAKPIELEALLSKAGQKDRTNVEKHLAVLDADHSSPHAKLWRRLMRALATLAPLAIQTVGQQAVQFFIADGKYRMQVFALEDQNDGQILLYVPDVLDEAKKLKIIADETVPMEQLTASNTPNPSPHYKNMLGWNRKAIKIVLPVGASTEQIETAEHLAALAARAWAGKA